MSCKLVAITLAVINVLISYYIYVDIFPISEEFYYNTTQFIQKYGYIAEEHNLFTESGYNVTIFRLLPKNGKISNRPFLLLGGNFCNSDVYVLFGPGKDLAFSLVDAGYDVWLLNDRGTKYGTRIEGSKAVENNSFGYHEIGLDELPAAVDYVIGTTTAKKVAVSGISAGCTSIMVLLSHKPEYNDKVAVTLHFGCALGLSSSMVITKLAYSVARFPGLVRFGGLLTVYDARAFVVHLFLVVPFLRDLFYQTLGQSFSDKRSAYLLATHGVSQNCYGILAHLMQNTGATELLKRDYGAQENLRLYNSTTPPPYDFSKVTVPAKFYYSDPDNIVDNKLTHRVLGVLNNSIGEYTADSSFSHIQFIAKCAENKHLVNDIITALNKVTFA